MKYKLIYSILFVWGLFGAIGAESANQVQVTLAPSAGDQQGLTLTITLPKEAHIYGPQKQDEGYPPEIKWESQENITDIHLLWPSEKTFTFLEETISGYKDTVEIPITLTLENPRDPIALKGTISFLMCDQVCTPVTQTISYEGPLKTTEKNLLESGIQEDSFLKMLLFALIGGIILNIMPCVLPALSLKIFSLLNLKQGNFREIPKHLLMTVFGMFVFFITLAFSIHLIRHLGTKVGWGFHFQEPTFIVFMCVILTLFTLSLWNFWHLHLPFNFSWDTRKDRHPYIRDFLEGLFASLLSTPCTAPFLGAAMGFAILKGGIYIYGVFIALWLGFSLPLLALAAYPQGVTLLPKPGKWMQYVQYVLGFFVFSTILWLLWTLQSEVHLEAFVGIICLLMAIPLIFIKVSASFQKTTFGILFLLILSIAFYGHKMSTSQESPIESILSQSDALKKKIFIEITASWCLTCHANQPMLRGRDVTKIFKKHKIQHVTIDWTGRQKDILTFMETHGRVGVPFYALYDPTPKKVTVLPEIITPSAILKAITVTS